MFDTTLRVIVYASLTVGLLFGACVLLQVVFVTLPRALFGKRGGE